jgi:hypothetical protein
MDMLDTYHSCYFNKYYGVGDNQLQEQRRTFLGKLWEGTRAEHVLHSRYFEIGVTLTTDKFFDDFADSLLLVGCNTWFSSRRAEKIFDVFLRKSEEYHYISPLSLLYSLDLW